MRELNSGFEKGEYLADRTVYRPQLATCCSSLTIRTVSDFGSYLSQCPSNCSSQPPNSLACLLCVYRLVQFLHPRCLSTLLSTSHGPFSQFSLLFFYLLVVNISARNLCDPPAIRMSLFVTFIGYSPSLEGHLPGLRASLQDSTPKGSQALTCCLLHL